MLQYNNRFIEYSYTHCQQCGVCEAVCPKNAISLDLLEEGTHKVIVDNEKCIKCQRCVKSCPVNTREYYNDYFKFFTDKRYFFGYSSNDKVRRESSSGGVCKTIVVESLRRGFVDGVYTLKRTDTFPFAEGEFYTKDNIPDYNDMPNSVYHSVMACRNINKIQKCKRLIIIGTSCQLKAANSVLKNKADEIIRVCIFCKQQKTLDSTRFLAKIMGTSIPENKEFFVRYRGKGWPGVVMVNKSELPWNRAAQIPFGRRLWTVPGCDICGDSYGINAGADISLMDPWIIRDENDLGETLITVHTNKGLLLLQNTPNLTIEKKKYEEVEQALSLKDIWRKQQLAPFYRGESVNKNVEKAGKAEILQQKILRILVEKLPRMPYVLNYAIARFFPDFRNKILK